jgi:hypothetical protein
VNVYATIDELKLYIGLDPLADTKDDGLLLKFAIQASRMFDTFATNGIMPKRRFYPTLATKDFDHPSEDPAVLRLYDDLLEVTTLTTKNGLTTIASSDYNLKTANGTYNQEPYRQIKLTGDGTTTAFEFDGTPDAANQIIGFWGYHDNWAGAWEDSSDTVQDDPLSNSATTLTVTDVDGDDINGIPNRFKRQQLLKIEDEILWITDTNKTDETLTVRRGMNGTTAASHVQTTAISVFKPMDDVVEAMQTLTAHLYRRKGSIGTSDERPVTGAQGQILLPSTLPEEVKRVLRPHRKESL